MLARTCLARTLSGTLPIYIVNEYPKSGGTWLRHMLAEALCLPQWTADKPRWGASVMHAHWYRPWGLRNLVLLWRDGRDVMVSYYYHCYFINELGNKPLVTAMRELLPFADYDDIEHNLPEFIRFQMTQPVSPRFTWPAFVQQWAKRDDVAHVRYEALLRDTAGELGRIVEALTGRPMERSRACEIAERHSFAGMKRRAGAAAKQAEEMQVSFLRSGKAGGWRQAFSGESLAVFDAHAGEALEILGYDRGPGGR